MTSKQMGQSRPLLSRPWCWKKTNFRKSTSDTDEILCFFFIPHIAFSRVNITHIFLLCPMDRGKRGRTARMLRMEQDMESQALWGFMRPNPKRRYGRWKCFFVYLFGGLECVGHSMAYVAHLPIRIFGRFLDSNPESCHSKHAHYQLSLPTPQLSHPSPWKSTLWTEQ